MADAGIPPAKRSQLDWRYHYHLGKEKWSTYVFELDYHIHMMILKWNPNANKLSQTKSMSNSKNIANNIISN